MGPVGVVIPILSNNKSWYMFLVHDAENNRPELQTVPENQFRKEAQYRKQSQMSNLIYYM